MSGEDMHQMLKASASGLVQIYAVADKRRWTWYQFLALLAGSGSAIGLLNRCVKAWF